MATSQITEIQNIISDETSIIQKGKRYKSDVEFLLKELRSERSRHSRCEEQMMVYADAANISKVKRLELLDNMVQLIQEDFPEPFDWTGKLYQVHYENCLASEDSDMKLFGKLLQLLAEHYNQPSAC